eukprot:TRINITY_DN14845_c0_g1_i4.p1 TRINITY_DN14845_c0_g1~~TRINITY_DN14845_c0_g1_i4.p1  ORF type:complete len:654 (+),score=84.69 TRINITY_DN14845_c0_g1_i4:37-1998(+)
MPVPLRGAGAQLRCGAGAAMPRCAMRAPPPITVPNQSPRAPGSPRFGGAVRSAGPDSPRRTAFVAPFSAPQDAEGRHPAGVASGAVADRKQGRARSAPPSRGVGASPICSPALSPAADTRSPRRYASSPCSQWRLGDSYRSTAPFATDQAAAATQAPVPRLRFPARAPAAAAAHRGAGVATSLNSPIAPGSPPGAETVRGRRRVHPATDSPLPAPFGRCDDPPQPFTVSRGPRRPAPGSSSAFAASGVHSICSFEPGSPATPRGSRPRADGRAQTPPPRWGGRRRSVGPSGDNFEVGEAVTWTPPRPSRRCCPAPAGLWVFESLDDHSTQQRAEWRQWAQAGRRVYDSPTADATAVGRALVPDLPAAESGGKAAAADARVQWQRAAGLDGHCRRRPNCPPPPPSEIFAPVPPRMEDSAKEWSAWTPWAPAQTSPRGRARKLSGPPRRWAPTGTPSSPRSPRARTAQTEQRDPRRGRRYSPPWGIDLADWEAERQARRASLLRADAPPQRKPRRRRHLHCAAQLRGCAVRERGPGPGRPSTQRRHANPRPSAVMPPQVLPQSASALPPRRRSSSGAAAARDPSWGRRRLVQPPMGDKLRAAAWWPDAERVTPPPPPPQPPSPPPEPRRSSCLPRPALMFPPAADDVARRCARFG